MTYWIVKSSKKEVNQKFILVDKASHRHKFDNKLKDDEEIKISRIKADIQDLVIEKIPEVQVSKVRCLQLESNFLWNLRIHGCNSQSETKKFLKIS